MSKRTKRLTVYFNDCEWMKLKMMVGENHQYTTTSHFVRGLVLGEFEHPDHVTDESMILPLPSQNVVENIPPKGPQTLTKKPMKLSGFISSSEEMMLHIQSIVVAADMMLVRSEPRYVKAISKHEDEFDHLLAQIRGYKYDEKTGKRTPLIKPKTK